MTAIAIEIATPEDVADLVVLEDVCFETDRIPAAQLRRFIKSSTALIIVAKQSNVVVGSAIILFRKNSRLVRLYSLATHPRCQSQGVAQRLCKYILQLAIKLKCTEIRLEVNIHNARAIHFYVKNGYETFGKYENFYENSDDALRMRKKLNHMELE